MKHAVTLLIETASNREDFQNWNWNTVFEKCPVINVEFVAASRMEEESQIFTLSSPPPALKIFTKEEAVSNFLTFLESLRSAKEPENRVNISENPEQGSVPKESVRFPNNSQEEMPIKEDEWEALPPRGNYLTEEAAQTDIVSYFRSKGVTPDYMLSIRFPASNGFMLTKASALAVVMLWDNGQSLEWADPTPF